MAYKVVFALACLCIVATYATHGVFKPEMQCTLAGGLCLLEDDCPHKISPEIKGLCPNQKADGAICCNKPQPDRCANGAGECISNCPQTIRQANFQNDCSEGQYCCVWL